MTRLNLDFSQFGLPRHAFGTISLPCEDDPIVVEGSLRQFLIQANRGYSKDALLAAAENKLKLRGFDSLREEDDGVNPFFYAKLSFFGADFDPYAVSIGSSHFENDNGIQEITSLCSNSHRRNARGGRIAFVSRPEVEIAPGFGQVISCRALIGTTVFYNDFRASYLSNDDDEIESAATEIHEGFLRSFPRAKLSIDFERV